METVAYCNRIRNSKPFYLDSPASGKYMVKEISKVLKFAILQM